MNFEFTASPQASDIACLTEGINDSSKMQGVLEPCAPFAFFLRNDQGKIVAGCNGYLVYGAIYTGQLWVNTDLRGQGIGEALMERVHEYGRQKNCKISTLRTMDFQNARPFYEKLGYVCQFEETGYDQGHVCYYLKKNLEEEKNSFIHLRNLTKPDIPIIVGSFESANWPKPSATFEAYFKEQEAGNRIIWVAHLNNHFAGYVTLCWQSKYQPFADNGIPEIMDLNVLPPYRGQGIATQLLARAEKEAATRSTVIGIGVGLYPDYGIAQQLYIKRGYIPDGKGITHNYQFIEAGSSISLDDDLILWFIKKLR